MKFIDLKSKSYILNMVSKHSNKFLYLKTKYISNIMFENYSVWKDHDK
jgi:hypothetical protein